MDDLIRKSGANRRVETLLLTFLGLFSNGSCCNWNLWRGGRNVSQETSENRAANGVGAQRGISCGMVLQRSLALTLGIVMGTGRLLSRSYLQSLLFASI